MPQRDDTFRTDLIAAGIAPEVLDPAIAIDAVLQTWRRRFAKRELGARAIADLALDIDLAQLDVLMAIHADAREFDDGAGETTVGTVAARLGIDPSRASRLIADLIRTGHVRRAVSQTDARRTIVVLSDSGATTVEKVRRYKFLIMGSFLQGWTAEEITTFLPLLERFSVWSETSGTPSPELADRIARLRDMAPDAAARADDTA